MFGHLIHLNTSGNQHSGWYVTGACVLAKLLQSRPTLCSPMDCSPPGSFVSRQEYWSGLPCPPPGDLPNKRVKTASLRSPALAGRFFTTGTTWVLSKYLLNKWINRWNGMFPILPLFSLHTYHTHTHTGSTFLFFFTPGSTFLKEPAYIMPQFAQVSSQEPHR